jgi:hypothetical protein
MASGVKACVIISQTAGRQDVTVSYNLSATTSSPTAAPAWRRRRRRGCQRRLTA